MSCDVGLVGFPNSGKSTLFNILTGRTDSRKMPRYGELADKWDPKGRPGLVLGDIAGIHWGKKHKPVFGEEGLRYIINAKILLFIIPFYGTNPNVNNKSRRIPTVAQYEDNLNSGVKRYEHLAAVCQRQNGFENKKRIIAVNVYERSLKDTEKDIKRYRALLENRVSYTAFVPVIATTGEGLQELVAVL